MQLNMLEAKNQLSQLVRAAQAGDEVVIANRGKAVVRLVAIAPAASVESGNAANLLGWLQHNPLPEYLQRSHEEIEARIYEERAAWD
ncbi:MAG: type II toxin-antitoxin system prevent-host-death family antitoxin [Rhodocyclaceae bacterium]|nr:type II toxin-antitoxin system prevent-host-death family antitoxin [Rhodocyclaceae bacterium]MDZ4214745.1 type II toxin-antitoxin system prevent-host-death family antitoxin [Rhodocyclaceae bacterium]